MNRRQALITMGSGIVLASTGGLVAASPVKTRNYLGLISNSDVPRLDLYVVGASSIQNAKEKLAKKAGNLGWPGWSDVSDCHFAITFGEDFRENKIWEAARKLPPPYDEYDVVYIVASNWSVARNEFEKMAGELDYDMLAGTLLPLGPYYVGRYFQLDPY
jgi:hypothetical protein